MGAQLTTQQDGFWVCNCGPHCGREGLSIVTQWAENLCIPLKLRVQLCYTEKENAGIQVFLLNFQWHRLWITKLLTPELPLQLHTYSTTRQLNNKTKQGKTEQQSCVQTSGLSDCICWSTNGSFDGPLGHGVEPGLRMWREGKTFNDDHVRINLWPPTCIRSEVEESERDGHFTHHE